MQQASEQQMSLLFVPLFARPTCSHEGYCEPEDWQVGPHHGCSLFDPADWDFAVSLAENNWDCVASSSLLKSRHETTTNCFRQIAMPWNNLSISLSRSLAKSPYLLPPSLGFDAETLSQIRASATVLAWRSADGRSSILRNGQICA